MLTTQFVKNVLTSLFLRQLLIFTRFLSPKKYFNIRSKVFRRKNALTLYTLWIYSDLLIHGFLSSREKNKTAKVSWMSLFKCILHDGVIIKELINTCISLGSIPFAMRISLSMFFTGILTLTPRYVRSDFAFWAFVPERIRFIMSQTLMESVESC